MRPSTGTIRWYRAAVRDSESGACLLVRSRELAEQIARLLEDAGHGCLPRQQETDATVARYLCAEQVPGVFRLFRTHGLLLGDPIGRSSDGDLCRRSAMLLNRVDPGKKIRVKTGIGWW